MGYERSQRGVIAAVGMGWVDVRGVAVPRQPAAGGGGRHGAYGDVDVRAGGDQSPGGAADVRFLRAWAGGGDDGDQPAGVAASFRRVAAKRADAFELVVVGGGVRGADDCDARADVYTRRWAVRECWFGIRGGWARGVAERQGGERKACGRESRGCSKPVAVCAICVLRNGTAGGGSGKLNWRLANDVLRKDGPHGAGEHLRDDGFLGRAAAEPGTAQPGRGAVAAYKARPWLPMR